MNDDDFTCRWQRRGLELCRAHDRDQWAIAHWYLEGCDTLGRKWCKAITSSPEWLAAGGLEYKTVREYGSIARKFPEPSIRIDVAFAHYQFVRSLPIEQAIGLLQRAQHEHWVVNRTRVEARMLRWHRPLNGTDIADDLNVLIEQGLKFRVIYADPPWKWERGGGKRGSAAPYYPTLSIEDLCKLPVAQIAADDCFLFLWCAPALFENYGLRVLHAWGFTYKTFACWDKMMGNYGVGSYWRNTHAPLLLGVRKNSPTCFADNSMSSMIRVPRSRIHSDTPDEVYSMIERAAPGGPFIELFARKRWPGWSAYGNQLPALETDSSIAHLKNAAD